MHWVYVLWNQATGTRYAGRTAELMPTLVDHDRGKYPATKRNGFWTVEHVEACETSAEAGRREKFLKSVEGTRWLDDVLSRKSSSQRSGPRIGT